MTRGWRLALVCWAAQTGAWLGASALWTVLLLGQFASFVTVGRPFGLVGTDAQAAWIFVGLVSIAALAGGLAFQAWSMAHAGANERLSPHERGLWVLGIILLPWAIQPVYIAGPMRADEAGRKDSASAL